MSAIISSFAPVSAVSLLEDEDISDELSDAELTELEEEGEVASELEDDASGAQIPLQSAPPASGSQVSDGSSIHSSPAGHARPAMPPHILVVDSLADSLDDSPSKRTTSVTDI